MTPLAGHLPIPPGWSAHHRPAADATHNATCDLYDGATGPAPYPLPEGWTPDGAPLTTGPVGCRVQRLVTENTLVQGEQVQATRRYQVTLPVAGVPDLTVTDTGPVLVIRTAGDDPGLAGVRLKVVDVQHGSYVWERVLIAVHNQTQE